MVILTTSKCKNSLNRAKKKKLECKEIQGKGTESIRSVKIVCIKKTIFTPRAQYNVRSVKIVSKTHNSIHCGNVMCFLHYVYL